MRALLAMVAVASAAAAPARPPDRRVELKPGEERILRHGPADVKRALVQDGATAGAEPLPAGEVMLTGKRPGSTLLLLELADGARAFWRLRVGSPPPGPEPDRAALEREAAKACTELAERQEDGERVLAARIDGPPCLAALRNLLSREDIPAGALRLTFTGEGIKAQVEAVKKRLIRDGLGALTVRAVGAGLVLEGRAPEAEARRAVWAIFEEAIGRLSIEDRVTRVEAPAR
jgi:hypothetical protein